MRHHETIQETPLRREEPTLDRQRDQYIITTKNARDDTRTGWQGSWRKRNMLWWAGRSPLPPVTSSSNDLAVHCDMELRFQVGDVDVRRRTSRTEKQIGGRGWVSYCKTKLERRRPLSDWRWDGDIHGALGSLLKDKFPFFEKEKTVPPIEYNAIFAISVLATIKF